MSQETETEMRPGPQLVDDVFADETPATSASPGHKDTMPAAAVDLHDALPDAPQPELPPPSGDGAVEMDVYDAPQHVRVTAFGTGATKAEAQADAAAHMERKIVAGVFAERAPVGFHEMDIRSAYPAAIIAAGTGPHRTAAVSRWAIRKCVGGIAIPREDFNRAAARKREAGTYYGKLANGEQGFGCLPSGAQTWLNRDVPDQLARRMDGVEVVLVDAEAGSASLQTATGRPSLITDLTFGPAQRAPAWQRETAGDVLDVRANPRPAGAAAPVPVEPAPRSEPEPELDLLDSRRVAAALVCMLRTERDEERALSRTRGLLARVADAARSVSYHQGYADALAVLGQGLRAAEERQRHPSPEDAERRQKAEHLPAGWTVEDLVAGARKG